MSGYGRGPKYRTGLVTGLGVSAICTDRFAAHFAFLAYEPMLERVCAVVLAMGYSPSECLIEHCDGGLHGIDHEHTERRLLKVLGEPCFEIATHRSAWVDHKCTVTHTPRLIAWPPYRPMTAHQLRAPSMGGQT